MSHGANRHITLLSNRLWLNVNSEYGNYWYIGLQRRIASPPSVPQTRHYSIVKHKGKLPFFQKEDI